MRDPVVAVDAMSGDHAPAALVEGAVEACKVGIRVVLVGTSDVARLLPRGLDIGFVDGEALRVDRPSALRTQPGASIRTALRLVADGVADAVVSCGNSGLTLVGAVLELGLVDGLERPAIGAVLPRADGGRLVLVDAGASAEVRVEHLVQFACLGEAYARVLGVSAPRIGVLSNGAEAGKGTRLVQRTVEVLGHVPLSCVGQVEPHSAMAGAVDVLVTDGFTGNVMLKSAEGAIEMLTALGQQALGEHPSLAEAAAALAPVVAGVRARVDWRRLGGALLLGVNAPVVIGHGRADAGAVGAAILQAHYAVSAGLVADLRGRLPALMAAASPWLSGASADVSRG